MTDLKVAGFVAGYCRQAGVEPPPASADGAYVLRFDGKYDVRFASDGRNHLLLRHDFTGLDRDTPRQEALERLLRINLVLLGRKRSILSIDKPSETPCLYDVVPLDSPDLDFKSVTMFVNEVVAFRRALDGRH
jgi:hypothetical protein